MLVNWIQNNFLYAIVVGVVVVIVGGALAAKADSKFGYVLIAGGVLFILYTMRLWSLI